MEEPAEDLNIEQAMEEIPFNEYRGTRTQMNPVGKLEFSLNKDNKQLLRLELDRNGDITASLPETLESTSLEGLISYANAFYTSMGEVPKRMTDNETTYIDSAAGTALIIIRTSQKPSAPRVEATIKSRGIDDDQRDLITPLVEFLAKAKGIPAQPVQRTVDSIIRERATQLRNK